MDKQSLIAYDAKVIDKVLANLDRITTVGISANTKLLEAHNLLLTAGVPVGTNKEESDGDNSGNS